MTEVGVCEKCGHNKSLKPTDFDGTGEVVTFTKVHRGASHVKSPYTLAVVKVNNEFEVLARIEMKNDENLKVGQKVIYTGSDDYRGVFMPQ